MARAASQRAAVLWRERFQRFEQAGVPVARFCEQEDCSTASFYQWRRRLADDGEHSTSDDGNGHRTFQPITVTVSRPLTIELAGGTRIEVPTENLEAVRAVVREVVLAEQPVEEGGAAC